MPTESTERTMRSIEQQWQFLQQQQQQQRNRNRNRTRNRKEKKDGTGTFVIRADSSVGAEEEGGGGGGGRIQSQGLPRGRVTSLDRREVLGHTEVLGSEDEYDCYLEDASYDENGSYDEQHSAYGNESSEEEEYETDDADSSSYFSAVHPTDHILEMCKNRHSNSMNGSSFRQKSYSSSDDNSDTPSYQRALRASNANGGASYAHHPTHYMGSMYQSAATHSHQQALVDYEYSSEEDDPEGMVDEARSIAIALTQQRGGEIYNHKESANFEHGNDDGYILYNERWVMLFWMSLLNLLSDWTCYSIAPIEAFVSGKYPTSYSKELLVTLFLTANAIASLCEPAILTRIGLRRTVLLGSILLCIGSILKGQIFGVLGGIHEVSYILHFIC